VAPPGRLSVFAAGPTGKLPSLAVSISLGVGFSVSLTLNLRSLAFVQPFEMREATKQTLCKYENNSSTKRHPIISGGRRRMAFVGKISITAT
jgi:hypothetical protein